MATNYWKEDRENQSGIWGKNGRERTGPILLTDHGRNHVARRPDHEGLKS